MKKELEEKWDEAERTGEPVDIGKIVVCDSCSEDYTDRTDKGGMIFGSYAYCPTCTKRAMLTVVKYNEESHIRSRCPEYSSFADFIRKYREDTGSSTIQIKQAQS